jgi:predicted transglutaminase-like cysteine proteinase
MEQTKATLEAVNHQVNEGTTYVSDWEQYRELDRWEDITETGQGDCEDYAIAKIRLLLEQGWPRADLRLAIVGVENPAGDHGIACARDAGGQWWALDNRFPYVMAPEELGYSWVEWGMGRDWNVPEWV